MSTRRRSWNATASGATIASALAVLITVYGGLLRLDAFTGKYGTLEHPSWARIVTQNFAPRVPALRPSSIAWTREATPYVGGDPANYLRFAREMRSFYQAHVREPVPLALIRGWLWALDDQDAAVSFASLTGSTLAVFAIYLVGSALLSPAAGVVAALLLAVEYEVITWAPDGWRDDTFTATVLFAVWSLLRLQRRSSVGNAVLAGALCGVACLTRITALSFVVPGILWLILTGTGSRRDVVKHASVAIGILTVVVAPFLVSCAMATGDPFFAINYHTIFYRHAGGQPITEPIGAAEYIRIKLAARPIATLDAALDGMFRQPFITKWHGFAPWFEGLGAVLRATSLAGVVGLAFFTTGGRLLLLLLLTSLAPYLFTWNLAGGNEWRFTMHAYPFYIVAAACALVETVRAGKRVVTTRSFSPPINARQLAVRGTVLAAIAVLGALSYFVLPWFVIREGIAKGESTSVETGSRDHAFYRKGWSSAHDDGVPIRVSLGHRSTVHIPLPVKRTYEIVLRLDPVDPASHQRVGLLMNGNLVGNPQLSWDPERVGTYRVRIRADQVKAINELTIIPEVLVPAGTAGPRFAWLDPTDRLGIRLWYVRVLPT
ncbi:MAG: glycosyltransferase family 39 protein [Vicinamibacterales bacterium]